MKNDPKILNVWELITAYYRMCNRLGETHDPKYDICEYLLTNEDKAPLGGGTEIRMHIEDGRWDFEIFNCFNEEDAWDYPASGPMIDLSKCPRCGGPADNGHNRSVPPEPYFCTKCDPDTEDRQIWEPTE